MPHRSGGVEKATDRLAGKDQSVFWNEPLHHSFQSDIFIEKLPPLRVISAAANYQDKNFRSVQRDKLSPDRLHDERSEGGRDEISAVISCPDSTRLKIPHIIRGGRRN